MFDSNVETILMFCLFVGVIAAIIWALFLMGRAVDWVQERVWSCLKNVFGGAAGQRGGRPPTSEAMLEEAKIYGHDTRLILIACAAKFAKIDGVVTKNELAVMETVLTSLELAGPQRPVAINVFNVSKNGKANLRDCVTFFRETHQSDPFWMEILAGMCFEIAHADGGPTTRTQQALADLCKWIDFNYHACAAAFERKKSHGKGTNVDAAYVVLSCKPSDSRETIRERYRKLVKEFHPDTVMSKNLAPEFIMFAEEQFKRIQAAYETVMQARA